MFSHVPFLEMPAESGDSKPPSRNPTPPSSPGKTKRRRKPKIIPDAYVGPFDFEEHETREKSRETEVKAPIKSVPKKDEFEPLQPGQKRRRRKKTGPSPEPDTKIVNANEDIPPEQWTVVDLIEIKPTDKPMQESKEQKKARTLSEVNEEVDWTYPKPGMEFAFELQAQHVENLNDKKVYRCDICLGIYKHMFSLKRHYLRNHVNYEYLSKADIMNCLINLAQVKQQMKTRELNGEAEMDSTGNSDHINNQDNDDGNDNTNGENEFTKIKVEIDVDEVKEVARERTNFEPSDEKPNGMSNGFLESQNTVSKDDLCSDKKEKEIETDEDTSNRELLQQCGLNTNSLDIKSEETNSFDMKNKDLSLPDIKKEITETSEVPETSSNDGISQLDKNSKKFPGLYRCYTCYELFDDAAGIRDHLPQHGSQGDGAMFSCDKCNMHFGFRKNLQRHLKRHAARRSESQVTDSSLEDQSNTGMRGRVLHINCDTLRS